MKNTNIDISGAEVSGIDKDYYRDQVNGTKAEPIVSVNGEILQEGKDYTLSYSNYKGTGNATVTITGRGRYIGSLR